MLIARGEYMFCFGEFVALWGLIPCIKWDFLSISFDNVFKWPTPAMLDRLSVGGDEFDRYSFARFCSLAYRLLCLWI